MFSRSTLARLWGGTSCWNLEKLPNVLRRQLSQLKAMFEHRTDHYGGLHFDVLKQDQRSLPNGNQFEEFVRQQLEAVTNEDNVRAIWFRVSATNADLISPLVKAGFKFHHTKEECVVLVKPLTPTSNIPKYAYTNIGVGALVVDSSDQEDRVLVIQERHFYVKPMWKFPGGYVEQGEELSLAAEREVFEETGVRAKFESVLLMRHLHRFAFDCADMYFVCLLRAKSAQISKCEHEIAQCQWASIADILPQMSPFNRFALHKYSQLKDGPVALQTDTLDPYFASMAPYTVYSIKSCLGGDNKDEI